MVSFLQHPACAGLRGNPFEFHPPQFPGPIGHGAIPFKKRLPAIIIRRLRRTQGGPVGQKIARAFEFLHQPAHLPQRHMRLVVPDHQPPVRAIQGRHRGKQEAQDHKGQRQADERFRQGKSVRPVC